MYARRRPDLTDDLSPSVPMPSVLSPSVPMPSVSQGPRSKVSVAELEMPSEMSMEGQGEKNVDQELLAYGYVPLNKILLSGPDQMERIRYIKAYNPYGELVYIYLDDQGYCQDNLCSSMVETQTGEAIPYTLRMTASECNNLDVCGVIFECEQGICSLHRKKDNPVEFDERVYQHTRLVGTPGRDYLWNKSIAMPYPIIRLSEIRANPKAILLATDESFKRMRNVFYETAVQELTKTGSLYNSLEVEAKKFQVNASVFSQKLMNDIIQLEGIADEHRLVPAPDETQKQNYRLVLANLRKRHEFLEEYLRHVDHYSRVQSMISSMIEDLKGLNMKMEGTIQSLGFVLPID